MITLSLVLAYAIVWLLFERREMVVEANVIRAERDHNWDLYLRAIRTEPARDNVLQFRRRAK